MLATPATLTWLAAAVNQQMRPCSPQDRQPNTELGKKIKTRASEMHNHLSWGQYKSGVRMKRIPAKKLKKEREGAREHTQQGLFAFCRAFYFSFCNNGEGKKGLVIRSSLWLKMGVIHQIPGQLRECDRDG